MKGLLPTSKSRKGDLSDFQYSESSAMNGTFQRRIGFATLWLLFLGLSLGFFLELCTAQNTGVVEGIVERSDGEPAHHATVLVVQLGTTVEADHEGRFRIEALSPGTYEVVAYSTSYTSEAHTVKVEAGMVSKLELMLRLNPISQSVTVTASGRHETTFQSVQSVTSLDSFDISERLAPSLGEVLEGETGVAKRSFGPGSSRPVVRGFDGDRVLIMQDGIRIGSVGAQSGDHGEPLDPGNMERVEVLRGPATLLYGSNAIGGVVNAVSRHHEMHKHRHEGIRGQILSVAGSNNGHAGLSAHGEFGSGNWMFWGGGGGQRTDSYHAPDLLVENSQSRIGNATAGLGWYGDQSYLAIGYRFADGRYGVPFAASFHDEDAHDTEPLNEQHPGEEKVEISFEQQAFRLDAGLEQLPGLIDAARVIIQYSDFDHSELEVLGEQVQAIGTHLDNQEVVLRLTCEQKPLGPLSGSFGFWGMWRDYDASGAEALSPPTRQTGFALFTLEEVQLKKVRFQAGARLERTQHKPEVRSAEFLFPESQPGSEPDLPSVLPERGFTGLSSSAGVRLDLWPGGALVGSYTSSFRAPSLQELYNLGPHIGNMAFEIGNSQLTGERSNGLDVSLRHSGQKVLSEINLFLYGIRDFIFLAPTGEIRHDLFEARVNQQDSRFSGAEVNLKFEILSSVWFESAVDLVDAKLSIDRTPLPRIPPLRGRMGLDFRRGGLSFNPELVLAAPQEDLHTYETRTAGYGVFNLRTSYTFPQDHMAHHFSLEVFNSGNRLYRNHVSFIKDLAPEIGRGVRLAYALKFF